MDATGRIFNEKELGGRRSVPALLLLSVKTWALRGVQRRVVSTTEIDVFGVCTGSPRITDDKARTLRLR